MDGARQKQEALEHPTSEPQRYSAVLLLLVIVAKEIKQQDFNSNSTKPTEYSSSIGGESVGGGK